MEERRASHARSEDDEEIRWTRHHPRWWEAWTTPAAFLVLFGGIVWGVQLNFVVLQHTKEIATLQQNQNKIVELMSEQSERCLRTTLLIDSLSDRMERYERSMGWGHRQNTLNSSRVSK